jgi:hypothetical protein
MRKRQQTLLRGSLEQLARRRMLERQDGSDAADAEFAAALDAVPWLTVVERDPWVGRALSPDTKVADELTEAHRLASCLVPLLGDERLLFVDCGCAHGLTSLLLYYFLPERCKPTALRWIDRDSSCQASKLAPCVLRPPVAFVQADFLQPDFAGWPSEPFVLLCNKASGWCYFW